ncbi:MAG: hypothetical protein ACE1ZM_08870, partial [Gammaproteobacteria bacterium]
ELIGTEQPIKNSVQIGTRAKTYKCITFAPAVKQGISWIFPYKALQINATTPAFRYIPLFFQTADVADPGDNIVWNANIMNTNLGTSLDADQGTNTNLVIGVDAKFIMTGTETAGPITATGDALSTSNINVLEFQLLRLGNDLSDDYANPIHLIGFMFQYASAFGNIEQWPV